MKLAMALLAGLCALILFALLCEWLPLPAAAAAASVFGGGYYWLLLWLAGLKDDVPPSTVSGRPGR